MSLVKGMNGSNMENMEPIRSSDYLNNKKPPLKGYTDRSQENSQVTGEVVATDEVKIKINMRENIHVSIDNKGKRNFSNFDEAVKFIKDYLAQDVDVRSFNNGKAFRNISLDINQQFEMD